MTPLLLRIAKKIASYKSIYSNDKLKEKKPKEEPPLELPELTTDDYRMIIDEAANSKSKKIFKG